MNAVGHSHEFSKELGRSKYFGLSFICRVLAEGSFAGNEKIIK